MIDALIGAGAGDEIAPVAAGEGLEDGGEGGSLDGGARGAKISIDKYHDDLPMTPSDKVPENDLPLENDDALWLNTVYN